MKSIYLLSEYLDYDDEYIILSQDSYNILNIFFSLVRQTYFFQCTHVPSLKMLKWNAWFSSSIESNC